MWKTLSFKQISSVFDSYILQCNILHYLIVLKVESCAKSFKFKMLNKHINFTLFCMYSCFMCSVQCTVCILRHVQKVFRLKQMAALADIINFNVKHAVIINLVFFFSFKYNIKKRELLTQQFCLQISIWNSHCPSWSLSFRFSHTFSLYLSLYRRHFLSIYFHK